jgi:hypothetical protein
VSDDRRRIIIIVDEVSTSDGTTNALRLPALTGLKVQVEFAVPAGMSNEQAGKRVDWVLTRVQQALEG